MEGKVCKLTVNLPHRVWQAVVAMSEEQDIAKTEALRRAISSEVFRKSVGKEGGRLLVEKPDGSVELVRFVY